MEIIVPTQHGALDRNPLISLLNQRQYMKNIVKHYIKKTNRQTKEHLLAL